MEIISKNDFYKVLKIADEIGYYEDNYDYIYNRYLKANLELEEQPLKKLEHDDEFHCIVYGKECNIEVIFGFDKNLNFSIINLNAGISPTINELIKPNINIYIDRGNTDSDFLQVLKNSNYLIIDIGKL